MKSEKEIMERIEKLYLEIEKTHRIDHYGLYEKRKRIRREIKALKWILS